MKKSLLAFVCFLSFLNVRSQGCSDAGVCSIGNMQTHSKVQRRFSIALNTQYGVGEQNVGILIPQLEFSARIDSGYGLQIKLPYVFASGNLGKTSGLGDIVLVGSKQLYKKSIWQIGLNAGFRIAVNNADKRSEGIQTANTTNILPMPYQTSLGTHDLLLGLDLKIRSNWLIALGLQLPLIQQNSNGFDTALVFSNETEKKAYFTSRHLVRRPDLVLRIDRQFTLSKNLSLNAGVLPIFHLGNDSYLDGTVRKTIEQSSGLTFNINAGIMYRLGDRFSITGRYASPLKVRTVRPDGLTRHYVGALELKYAF